MKLLKIILFAIGVVLLVHGLGFAQTASVQGSKDAGITLPHGSKVVDISTNTPKANEPKTIVLKPTQLQILTDLDSAKIAFNADVEKNKEAINTFNTLIQRSNALGNQQKQAYDLIVEAAGYDPKKYVIIGIDLKKGELQVKENK